MMKDPEHNDTEALEDCVRRLLQSRTMSRDAASLELLDYLVKRTIANNVPKEFDIAVDLYGKGPEYSKSGDSQIRVRIFKLRSKLKEYYSEEGQQDPYRLKIPRGGYRATVTPQNDFSPKVSATQTKRATFFGFGALAVLAAITLISIFLVQQKHRPVDTVSTLSTAPVWDELKRTGRPILIVVGELFMFREIGAERDILVRDTSINSVADMTALEQSQTEGTKYIPVPGTYPIGIIHGLKEILFLLGVNEDQIRIKPSNQLTPEELRTNNIVFLGLVKTMSILRDFYLTQSHYAATSPFFSLSNNATGKVYSLTSERSVRRVDYGLFARLLGPNKNTILIFTGTGGAGMSAAIHHLANADSSLDIVQALQSIESGLAGEFEILLEVQGFRETDFETKILETHRIPYKPNAID